MLSIPPATTTSLSPRRMLCIPSITAFIPLPQTLLIVSAGTVFGTSAKMAA